MFKKYYFIAPNFTTAPPPEGPIQLGSILRNLCDFEPLNQAVQRIPQTQLDRVDIKADYKTDIREYRAGVLSFKVTLDEMVAAFASMRRSKDKKMVLTCDELHTSTFTPTDDYIYDSVFDPDVLTYFRASKFRHPVYMVTGLKISRRGSMRSSTRANMVMKSGITLAPAGSPVAVGTEAGHESNHGEGEEWVSMTDFIVAFKVKRLTLHGVKSDAFTKKAVMRDASSSSSPETTFNIQSDDDLPLEEVEGMRCVGEWLGITAEE